MASLQAEIEDGDTVLKLMATAAAPNFPPSLVRCVDVVRARVVRAENYEGNLCAALNTKNWPVFAAAERLCTSRTDH